MPTADHYVEIRLIGAPEDVAQWADLINEACEVALDNGNRTARKDGHVRRYMTARLVVDDTPQEAS